MTRIVRKGVIVVLTVMLVAVGGYAFAQEKYSAAALAEIDELKILSRDRKDMPPTMPGVKLITSDELKKWMAREGNLYSLTIVSLLTTRGSTFRAHPGFHRMI